MRGNGVNLLNDRGVVKIKGIKIPFVSSRDYLSLAVCKTCVVIPPRSSKLVSFRTNALKKNVPFKIISLPSPTPGLFVETMPKLCNGRVCAVSRNNTPFPIRLSRNTPIGYAVRSDSLSGLNGRSAEQTQVRVEIPPNHGDRDTVVKERVTVADVPSGQATASSSVPISDKFSETS
jgi:hypothetical protein